MRVFVQLAHGTDAATWQARLADGRLLGVNEQTPYGYGLASQWGCDVRFSVDARERAATRVARKILRRLLGFDLVHVWRNRRELARADAVWTHTEDQTLAVLLLHKWRDDVRARPCVIGQSIWLFDAWPRLGAPRRALYRWLLRSADVLTVHSPLNLDVVRTVVPETRSELVRFGIATCSPIASHDRRPGRPVQLLCVGDDRDRDWATLFAAVAGDPRYALTIVSTTIPPRLLAARPGVRRVEPADNGELFALYAQADISIVPLRPNLHVSGCTVTQESALMGVPLVCSRAGGLDAYFDDTQVRFVPIADAPALRRAIDDLADDPDAARAQAERAAHRLATQLGAPAFVRRHVELSRDALARSRGGERSVAA